MRKEKKQRKYRRSCLVWSVPSDTFALAVRSSNTIADTLRKIGVGGYSFYYKTVRARILEESIDASHFAEGARLARRRKPQRPLVELLCTNSSYPRHQLKKRILREGLIPYVCSGVGCTLRNTWLGDTLSLHLDHVNGVRNDDRIENLRFLCPNCHSQTSTYSGRNIAHKKIR